MKKLSEIHNYHMKKNPVRNPQLIHDKTVRNTQPTNEKTVRNTKPAHEKQ